MFSCLTDVLIIHLQLGYASYEQLHSLSGRLWLAAVAFVQVLMVLIYHAQVALENP
jgi:hypothetical protein